MAWRAYIDADLGPVKWFRISVFAAKEYRCAQCDGVIENGQGHYKASSMVDGSWMTIRYHWNCED